MKILYLEIAMAFLAIGAIVVIIAMTVKGAPKARKGARTAARKVRNLAAHWRNSGHERNGPPLTRMRTFQRLDETPQVPLVAELGVADTLAIEVEKKLEQAFELYIRKRISIKTYRSLIEIEARALNSLHSSLFPNMFDSAPAARVAQEEPGGVEEVRRMIDWCLAWADQQELQDPAQPDLSTPTPQGDHHTVPVRGRAAA